MEYEPLSKQLTEEPFFKGYQSSVGHTSIEDNYLCLGCKYFKNHLGPEEFSLIHPWRDEHLLIPP